jgi:hypothetical protein
MHFVRVARLRNPWLSIEAMLSILQKWYIEMTWTVEFLDDEVRMALEALPRDIQANFAQIS